MSPTNYLRNAEANAIKTTKTGFYTGSGRNSTNFVRSKQRNRRGIAAIAIIAAIVIGGGAITMLTNLPLHSALTTLTATATDTQSAALARRYPKLFARMMSGQGSSWEGGQAYTSVPDSLKQRLASNGVSVSSDGTSLTYQNQTITSSNFQSSYDSNIQLQDAYYQARYGDAANHFDDAANASYLKNGTTRNIYNNYQTAGESDSDTAKYNSFMNDRFDGYEAELSGHRQGEIEDEEGKIVEVSETDAEQSSTKSGTSQADAETKASNYISGIAGKAARVTNWTCTLYRAGNLLATAIASMEMYQSMQYFYATSEPLSKAKDGRGDESAINEVLNDFTTPATTTVKDYNNASLSGIGTSEPSVSLSDTAPITGAATESQGMQFILAGATPDQSITSNYTFERVAKTVGSVLAAGGTRSLVQSCAVGQAGTSAATLALTIVPGIGQVSMIGNFIVNLVVATGISISISAFLSFMIPTLADVMFTNNFENLQGVLFGEEWSRGASVASTFLARNASGQMPGSKEYVLNYEQVRQDELAKSSALDRSKRSPLDTSSPNTFLGNIAYTLLPFINSSSTSAINSVLQTTAKTLSKTTTGVYASGEGSSFMTTFGDCPETNAIGADGEFYCTPVTVTDTSTLDLDPDDPTYISVVSPNLECSDGKCDIIEGSEMAKFNSYCMNRTSPFGILDANILNDLELGNSFLNSLPIIGEIIDIINAGIDLATIAWATGANCVASSENPRWDTEMKYYQRYFEDQRLLTQMGAYDDSESPVARYEAKYLESHPIDNSDAGYLARISGMTKSDAEDIIALTEYYYYIANYNTNNLDNISALPTSSDNIDFEDTIFQLFTKADTTPTNTVSPIISQFIYSTDLRDRSFIV